MQTTKRRIDPAVIQQLLLAPHGFQFFQAMRLIEHTLAGQTGLDVDWVPAHVRFQSTLSMGYPSAEIQELQAWSSDGDPLDREEAIEHAISTESISQIRITPAFMGMLGPYGALPLHYSELIAQREIYQRDRAARAFFDIFTTRALALHYAAWKKYRLAIQHELDPKTQFIPLLLSFSGMGTPGLRQRLVDGQGDVFDHALAYYAGHVHQRPVSAEVLGHLLREYFNVPVAVEQFVGAWYQVPQGQVSRLGMNKARLGVNALLGRRVWQRDLRLKIQIGPLQREQYEAFLPEGQAAQALAKWLTLLTGKQLEYEIRLLLRAEDIKGCEISAPGGSRLGWNSYLSTQPEQEARGDFHYILHGPRQTPETTH